MVTNLAGNKKNLTMDEMRCVDAAPLIVGGTEAIPMEFPHMVIAKHLKDISIIIVVLTF